jgi:hypothetical protein
MMSLSGLGTGSCVMVMASDLGQRLVAIVIGFGFGFGFVVVVVVVVERLV